MLADPSSGARREEILATAAALFASSGLRTSLREIADASGILPGSLYHHFESKEAIIIELVQRYLDDLDRVAKEARDSLFDGTARGLDDRVTELGRAIAACGVRHRAALLLTLYDPPTAASDELAALARRAPTAIDAAMLETLRLGRSTGAIRSGVDLELLASRLCQSMLHVGVGVSHLSPGAEQVPEMRCRILLRGLAVQPPSDRALDDSDALRAAQRVIETWDGSTLEDDDRITHLRSVARSEFGRRGYEATTVRDIAAAAGVSTGAVYRFFGSKDELLFSMMRSYAGKVATSWDAVLRSSSLPSAKLDALMWVNVNVLERFSDEFKIQLAWLRRQPPSTPSLGLSFEAQLRKVKSLLTAGAKASDLQLDGSTAEIRARCVYELLWTPENIVRDAGTSTAHALARDTVLRGALVRS